MIATCGFTSGTYPVPSTYYTPQLRLCVILILYPDLPVFSTLAARWRKKSKGQNGRLFRILIAFGVSCYGHAVDDCWTLNFRCCGHAVDDCRTLNYQFQRTDKQGTRMANDNPSPTGFLAWAGFGCALFGLACLCISFASPYWMQTYPNSFNTFRNIGLWEVCMDNYMHHKDDSQEIYSGCWWVFNRDKKYWKLREWLLPRK